MTQLIKNFSNASLKIKSLITAIALGFYQLSAYILDQSYARSKFPVPYFVQQTSFDSAKMKEWYAFMIQNHTFDIYLQTQFIDFLFIFSVIIGGFCLWSLTSHLHPENNFFRTYGRWLAFALPAAGLFDILENLISFFMIANPADFSNWLVYPYSGFGTLKFACWGVGLVWLSISIIAIPVTHTIE